MKVYELRSWLEDFDDDANVIIEYDYDGWDSYYGSDITVTLDGKDVILVIEN